MYSECAWEGVCVVGWRRDKKEWKETEERITEELEFYSILFSYWLLFPLESLMLTFNCVIYFQNLLNGMSILTDWNRDFRFRMDRFIYNILCGLFEFHVDEMAILRACRICKSPTKLYFSLLLENVARGRTNASFL